MQVIQMKAAAHHCHKFSLVTWLSMMPCGIGYPFGQLSQLCPLPIFCAPPTYSLMTQCKEQERL